MVDETLLKEIKNAHAGSSAASEFDIKKALEFIKQISAENEDIQEEIEVMDITIQMIIKDANLKLWLTVKEGVLDYGDGNVDNPSLTILSPLGVLANILMGEVDATSAYMAGDITVEGNLQDAMVFQEILEIALEAFEGLIEDL